MCIIVRTAPFGGYLSEDTLSALGHFRDVHQLAYCLHMLLIWQDARMAEDLALEKRCRWTGEGHSICIHIPSHLLSIGVCMGGVV